MLSWSRVDLESKRVSWSCVALETRVSRTWRITIRYLWGRLYRDRHTEADLIERDKLLEVFWVVLKQWLKYLMEERHKRLA